MLLIYPPGARSCEPPLGIARLAAFLKDCGREARCLDLCRESMDYLLGLDVTAADPWSRGAIKRRFHDLELLRTPATYSNIDRYTRSVLDINRAMRAASKAWGVEVGLADYRDLKRSPLRKRDIIAAAESYDTSFFYPLFYRRIKEEISISKDPFIGISIVFLSQVLPSFALIGCIKSLMPNSRIILGGGLITSWVAQGCLSQKETFEGRVEVVLPGRGEDVLAPYLGIDAYIESVSPDFSDFDTLSYISPEPILPYNFSTGCPWRHCTFCPETVEKSKYTGLPFAKAIEEISILEEKFKPGLFHFTDNEIAPLYLKALAERHRATPWYGFARFTPILSDPSFCARLARSGCRMLQLGLESGDQAVLDAVGKGTEIPIIDRVLECLAEAGIATYIYVLFGTPPENRDAALRTRDFLASRSQLIGFLNVAIFNLPSTSEEAKRLPTREFYEGDLSLYREFQHPYGWNRDEIRHFLSHDFKAEPSLHRILKRTPPVFTSSHASFFCP